ncbi:30S ribosomal protein S4e [Candidatus Woesearchaeota archaeon]|nr:30S ribosomal protein S4e [Candidatus Woesearchaeota archaeon]
MIKNHLKRIAAPKAWNILRKSAAFVTRSKPGKHTLADSLPVSVVLRDMISIADTVKEVKYLLTNKQVLVNGKVVRDHRMPVGLLDIIELPSSKECFRLVLNRKGKLAALSTKEKDVVSKIVNKTLIRGGKIQLQLNDGCNVLLDKDQYKTGDSIVVDKKKIKEHFALAPKAYIFLTGGKHIGDAGVVEEILGSKILYKNKDKEVIETEKSYAFVIGNEKPSISVQ